MSYIFEEDCKPSFLEFNEANLNIFLQNFAGRYSYIVQRQKELKENISGENSSNWNPNICASQKKFAKKSASCNRRHKDNLT